jgi:cold shock CspA family protein
VKLRAGELNGRVSRLLAYEGYGFITAEDGSEIYFHKNSVPDGGFDRLTVGTEVRYVETEGEQGPQASTVVPRGHPAPVPSGPGEVF